MKSSKMLILFVVATANVLNATNLKPFFNGQVVDEKGQTYYHKMAKNCTRKKYFEEQMQKALVSIAQDVVVELFSSDPDKKRESSLELDEKNRIPQDIPEEFLVLVRDKQGKTARDYAKEMYRSSNRCQDCADLMIELEDLEMAVLREVAPHILKQLEEASEKMVAQQPDVSGIKAIERPEIKLLEDGAQLQ